VQIECRTLVVDDDSQICFDSTALGVDDGFGCALADGRLALMRRTTWEVLIIAASGAVESRIDLCPVSKRLPRVVTSTPRGTLLVAFVDSVFEVDIAEFDPSGGLLWYLPRNAARVGCPSNVCLSEAGNILVADDFRHTVLEIGRDGQVVWQFGDPKHPAHTDRHLSAPKCVRPLPGGRRLIADAGNHRVVVVEGDRVVEQVTPGDADLRAPGFADLAPDGGFLICDTGNRRVVELESAAPNPGPKRQWGSTLAERRAFSFPRSIEVRGDRVLVADTAHNRVVEIADGRQQTWESSGDAGLFWPRSARRTPTGSIVVADGRNSRIAELGPDGGLLRELDAIEGDGRIALSDPHDVRALPNGHLLLADSSLDIVAEVDWNGRVHRLLGGDPPTELDDPHTVQALDDGQWLICDSGNSRLVWVGPDGRIRRELTALSAGARHSLLSRPRFAEITPDATLLIVDSGNNRILAADLEGELIWELSEIPDSPISYFDQPRWAQLLSRDEVVVSDHSNHRVVHLKYRGGAGG
jgi:DNA-binding beta-propeller fold protein YncE